MAVKWLSHKSDTPPLMPLNLRSLIIMCSARQEVANITFTWCCPFMRNAFMWYCAGRHECTNTITGVIPSCLHSTSYTQMPLNLRSLVIMCSARQEVANITFTWCCPFMRNAFMWCCAGRHKCTNTITGVIPSCLHSASCTQMPLNLRSLIVMCSARQEVANITFTWCCPFMRHAFTWCCAGRHECTNTITGVIPSCLHSTSYTQMPLNLRSLIILCSARQEVANTKLHLVLPFRARCLHVVLRRAAQVHKYMFKRVGLRISTR